MIRIYPSKLAGGPLESHQTTERMTLEQWLRGAVPSFERRSAPPISIRLNGETIDPAQWGATKFCPADEVDICVEPKGDPITSTILAVAAVKTVTSAIMSLIMPKMPKPAGQGGGKAGDQLAEVAAKGNKAKLNATIREIAGRRKVYPDYILPMRRYFGAPREQWAEMLLCVGKGKYQINPAGIQIGDTSIVSLGADAEYTIYQPGADLSAEPAAKWWHSASEVGATSSGTAGMDLRAAVEYETPASASAFVFSGFTVTIPTGAGAFPVDWEPNLLARIELPEYFTVIDGGADRDIIEGNFTTCAPFAGMLIEIVGANAGLYEVFSWTPPVPPAVNGQMTLNYQDGSPAVALQLGALQMGIGYRGLTYRITAASTASTTVERLTDGGATDASWAGFASITSNSAVVALDESTTQGEWCGPFAACPEGETTTTIEWDIFFPGGLVYVVDGARHYRKVETEMQWRAAGSSDPWNSVLIEYREKTLDQLGFTESVTLPSAIRPEVRMRRIGADSPNPAISDTAQWYGLRSLLQGPTSYAGVTTMAVRVRGGNRLAAQSEQLVSVVATRVLPVRNGGEWGVETPTRDIAPWVAYVAQSIGYSDADIDLAELDRLDLIWRARSDYFDAAVESASTVKQSLVDALQAGFSDITIDRGLIRPVRDEPRATFEHMYTPQNIVEGLSRKFSAVQPDDFDGVDVEYIDGATWQVETVECRLPGDLGRRVEKLKLDGVTSRTKAWRIGMRQRRSQRYRRWGYSWSTELDALNSRYLSYCAVADDVPGYGQSALMLSYTAGVIESSEPLDWSAGGAHVVAVRRPDGTLDGPYAATRVDDYRLQVAALGFVPDTSWSIEPPHILFGPVTRWSYPVLITAISPGNDGASVDAVNYDARVYADDDNVPD